MNSEFPENIDSQWQQLGTAFAAENLAWNTEPPIWSDFCAVDLFSTVTIPEEKQTTPAEQPPAKPKKKRIRRQKLELEYLRKLVISLEEQMSELKAKQPPLVDDSKKDAAETNVKAPSVWKGIAERQLQERIRVEEKNQTLRASLEGQLKLAMKLEGLLRKRPRDKEVEMLADPKRFKPLTSTSLSPTDDEIFADQLAHVQRANLEVDRIFGAPEFADQTASFYNLLVVNDSKSDTGVAFVKKASSMLPFDINVAEKAFWRALAEEGTKKDSYFLDEQLSSNDMVVSSYGLHFRAGTFHANVLGKQTYRKYAVDDRVVIMWKWVVDPVEVNGTKFGGVRCHETGWIVLRGVNIGSSGTSSYNPTRRNIPSSSVTSTLLQSYSKMTMELQDSIVNQDLQAGALTNFVVNLHDTLTEVCGKIITDALVEEDWNLNGWLGTELPSS